MNHALIIGGSGFIGQHIVKALIQKGWSISVFDIVKGKYENSNIKYYVIDVQSGKLPTLKNCTAIINLAGAPINKKFTKEYKKLIWSSRVITTRSIRQWLDTQSWQPKIYIGASAVGYYGNRGNELLSEKSKPGTDFLAETCINWEREHLAIHKLSIPVAILRQGNIIGNGGYIRELAKLYNYGIRSIPGSGTNYVPWIDIRDLVTLYVSLCSGTISPGIYNAVCPIHLQFKDISQSLKQFTKALFPLHIPLWLLKLVKGEFAESIVASQRVQTSDQLIPLISHTNISESIQFALQSGIKK